MHFNMSEGNRRKLFRRAVATIAEPSLRALVITAPHKALISQSDCRVGFIWRASGPVPESDPPIAGPILDDLVRLCARAVRHHSHRRRSSNARPGSCPSKGYAGGRTSVGAVVTSPFSFLPTAVSPRSTTFAPRVAKPRPSTTTKAICGKSKRCRCRVSMRWPRAWWFCWMLRTPY